MENKRRKIDSRAQPEGELQLFEHWIDGRREYELVSGGVFVMATYNALSSELLVRRAVAAHAGQSANLLIGGLGFGYSAREALSHGGRVTAVDVVELEQAVIEWNRGHLSDVNGAALFDPRVKVIQGDFIEHVARTEKRYDIICMDIDNGPMLLVKQGNAAAYDSPFFERVREVLLPGGVFCIWSCEADNALLARMRGVFADCREDVVMERHQGRELPYYLYYGRTLEMPQISRAEATDLAAILALQKLAYQSEAELVGDYSIPPLTQTLDSITEDFHNGAVLKAVGGGAIVGSVRVRFAGNTSYIGRLIVAPPNQGQGIGTALLSAAEKLFPAARFELFTSDKSTKNLSFYAKNGYSEYKRESLNEKVGIVFLEKHAK